MNEEVAKDSIRFAFNTTKVSVRLLIRAMQAYMAHRENVKNTPVKGKQTVKQLVRHSNGLKQVPVQGEHLREFEKVLKKYGVDFAVMRETKGDTPRYMVFFKAKDESMISNVLQESTKKQLEKGKIEKKPSILAVLKKAKEMVAATPAKTRQKEKDLSL